MSLMGEDSPDIDDRVLVEGFAEIVRVDGETVLMEPDQLSSCGGCQSAATCGAKTGPRKRLNKRFVLANDFGGQLGDRVVVGIAEDALVRASLTAYGLPLVAMIGAGLVGQNLIGGDAAAAVSAVVGLGVGMVAARVHAQRLTARGELSPRFLRFAAPGEQVGEDCHSD
jgi:sigma-E factor negative regulatory protein RseC